MLTPCVALHPIPSTRGLEISLYPFLHLSKKPATIGVFFASLFASITPITMRLLGLLPPTGTSAWFAIIFVFTFIAATLGLSGFISVSSIMADVVEDAAVTIRQRSEGRREPRRTSTLQAPVRFRATLRQVS
jgi:glycoside/pentoside/hexuronide:cation symporter, GPH family